MSPWLVKAKGRRFEGREAGAPFASALANTAMLSMPRRSILPCALARIRRSAPSAEASTSPAGGEQRAGGDVAGGDGDIARGALDGHGLARHLAAVLHDLLPRAVVAQRRERAAGGDGQIAVCAQRHMVARVACVLARFGHQEREFAAGGDAKAARGGGECAKERGVPRRLRGRGCRLRRRQTA